MLSKKKYLLLLVPVILIAVFIVVNYKPLSLAVEYYNETNVYSLENNAASLNYLIQKVESDVAGNNYKQYMLDITDYYITSDFVYVIFDKLGILESYYNGILSKLVEQTLFISVRACIKFCVNCLISVFHLKSIKGACEKKSVNSVFYDYIFHILLY